MTPLAAGARIAAGLIRSRSFSRAAISHGDSPRRGRARRTGGPPGRVLRGRLGHAVRERLDELVAQVAIELGHHLLRQQPGGRVAFPKQH